MSPSRRHEAAVALQGLLVEPQRSDLDYREWDEVVLEAHSLTLLATAVASEGAARARGGAHGRDAVTLGADALLSYEADPMQEALTAALERYGPNAYSGLAPEEIVELLSSFNDAGLRNIMNAVQGTMLELRVEELLSSGAIDFPDGAIGYELAGRTERAVDGWFLDADGQPFLPFQIKASRSADPISQHLAENPDVDLVFANTEAADLAQQLGYDTVEDTGISLDELLPDAWGAMPDAGDAFTDELVTTLSEQAAEVASQLPLITFALIGAELTWTRLRGGDMDAAKKKAGSRGITAAGLSAAGYAVSAATGFEYARLAIVVGGQTTGWVLSRMETELADTTVHLRQLQGVVTALQEPTPV